MTLQMSRLSNGHFLLPPLLNKEMITKLTRCGKLRTLMQTFPYSYSHIKNLIRTGDWVEGVHYFIDRSGDRLYNLPEIEAWLTRQNPINLETEGGSIDG
jgi:hypothetical protein